MGKPVEHDASPEPSELVESDVVVVGGGPAGLSATRELARAGVDVVLVDDGAALGGQYYKPRAAGLVAVAGEFRPRGAMLAVAARDAGARVLSGVSVWGVDDDGRTLLAASGAPPRLLRLRGRALLVATGAYERVRPFPGWQLPGVVTPGHALHLATCDLVPLGRRVVVAGTGPFLLAAASAVLDAGGGVAAVVERSRPYGPSLAAIHALRAPGRLVELAGYLRDLARHRVRLLQSSTVAAALGSGQVSAVRITRPGGRSEVIAADALAAGFGFRPSSELLQLLDVPGRIDALGDFYPGLVGHVRTRLAGVYAAGEVAGVAGARAASARGVLAAAAILDDLGRLPIAAPTVQLARAELGRELRFARLIDRLFPVRAADLASVADETLLCRCEGVTAGEVRRAAHEVGADAGAAKGRTRAGMGPCQGRLCTAALAAVVAASGGRASAPPPVRPPIRPVPFEVLAAGAFGAAGQR